MTKEQKMVRSFMKKAKQKLPEKPTIPNLKTRKLRAKLMLEEVLETINKGLGLVVMQKTGLPKGNFFVNIDDTVFLDVKKPDLVELADGLGDLHVVAYCGTANACGIDMQPVFEAIHVANMKKFGPGSSIREDGKQLKPPGWQHPDIKSIIGKQILCHETKNRKTKNRKTKTGTDISI